MRRWCEAIAAAILLTVIAAGGCGRNAPVPKAPEGLSAPGVTVEGAPAGNMNRESVLLTVVRVAAGRGAAPEPAGFDPDSGQITEERPGWAVDTQATVEEVMNSPPDGKVSLVMRRVPAELTASRLGEAAVAGSYVTVILDDSPGRMVNIRLTAALINNALIAPGEEFSFNASTGEPTAARGFQPAGILRDGRREEGVGGGMCQVSSTLYNAALAAGFTVTERHPHSLPVAYVPHGRDATTYTDKDLRFINTGRGEIVIRAVVREGSVAVDLLALPH